MLISGVHFELFFSPKEAELKIRRLQKKSCIPEKSQKTKCWEPNYHPPPLGHFSVKLTIVRSLLTVNHFVLQNSTHHTTTRPCCLNLYHLLISYFVNILFQLQVKFVLLSLIYFIAIFLYTPPSQV